MSLHDGKDFLSGGRAVGRALTGPSPGKVPRSRYSQETGCSVTAVLSVAVMKLETVQSRILRMKNIPMRGQRGCCLNDGEGVRE